MKIPKLYRIKYNILAVIIALFVIIGCQHEYPPMSEYQVVGYIPIDSVKYGKLFISGNSLFALYDTTYNNYWTKMREYDLSDSLEPTLINTDDLEPINPHYYITHQDSFVFFNYNYNNLQILNLHTLQSVVISIDYNIKALAYQNNFLFISTNYGLIIWDITDLENYIEIYNENDSLYRWRECMVLRDTILFELYNGSENKFKFWNIEDPHQPQIITQGDFPYEFSGVGITAQFIIGFDYTSIYRFKYDFSDSLIFEESCSFDYYQNEHKVSDSLIYLLFHDCLKIIKINDFDEQWIISLRCENYYYYYYYSPLSQEIYNNKIYLFSKRGIHIFERRES